MGLMELVIRKRFNEGGHYGPIPVANSFIEAAGEEGINHCRLQKLVYLAQGISLAGDHRPKIWWNPIVELGGPCYEPLYEVFKYKGGELIQRLENTSHELNASETGFDSYTEVIDEKDGDSRRFLSDLFWGVKGISTKQLSAFQNGRGTPWRELWDKGNYGVQIPLRDIRKQFEGLEIF